jgi:hypothetical protein
MAHDGGFDLGDYPAVRRWLGDVEQRDGHLPLGCLD